MQATTTKVRQEKTIEEDLLQLLPTGIVVINASGLIVKINVAARQLLGDDLLGCMWIDVISKAFAPRKDDGHEVSLKDGRRLNIAIRSLSSMAGQLITLTDITKTRAFEQAKNRQERFAEMGEMTAHLAHQIRTPLASAMLYTEHLRKEELPLDKREYCLKQIKLSHLNIEQQIRDLLFFAKGDDFSLQQSSLSDFIMRVVGSIEGTLEQNDVKFDVKNSCQEFIFSAHMDSLAGALTNLIDNAMNANANSIQLKVQLINLGFLRFSIIDDGDGIDEEYIEKIMTPFFTTRAKGTGLGLAVVNTVATNHGGSVDVISKKGKGSCFCITIPLIKITQRETGNESSIDS